LAGVEGDGAGDADPDVADPSPLELLDSDALLAVPFESPAPPGDVGPFGDELVELLAEVLPVRESVMYQPLPLKTIPTG
jgi:hypothetical protein